MSKVVYISGPRGSGILRLAMEHVKVTIPPPPAAPYVGSTFTAATSRNWGGIAFQPTPVIRLYTPRGRSRLRLDLEGLKQLKEFCDEALAEAAAQALGPDLPPVETP